MVSLKYTRQKLNMLQKVILGGEGVAVKASTFLENELGVIAIRNFKPGNLVFTIKGPISPNRTKYSFQFGSNEHIEPVNEKDGSSGLGHFLNHSCNPNVGIRIIRRGENGFIQVVARKDIGKGEEVKADYASMEFETTVESLTCRCNSKRCRGELKGLKHLPQNIVNSYSKEGLIPPYLLKLYEKKAKARETIKKR